MIVIKNGDILNATENLICHQVNIQGVMGGGLALQIAKSYPNVEKEYKEFCNKYKDLLIGKYQVVKIGKRKYIVNCFSQQANFDTDYEAIKIIFEGLLQSCKLNDFTIAVPYKYGCGIAHGDWEEVQKIFEDLSNKYEVPIVIYKLESEVK